jgi:N-carbamoyl-L-amino-acid hydrolase
MTETNTDLSLGSAIMTMAERLAAHTETPGTLTCTYMSEAHRATARQIAAWMEEAGLETRIDVLGNVVGRCAGSGPGTRRLLTGSHYDTVRNGGRYDGRLGILLPIAAIAELARQGRRPPVGIEVVAFGDEEGVRFGTTLLGSSALAGRFDLNALALTDEGGLSLGSLLGNGRDEIAALRRDPAGILGYVEVHIEQGPVLLHAGQPLGVVTAIAGGVRRLYTVTGVAGHAGTVPMALRHDAAAAAAEMTLAVESICNGSGDVVGTVGRLDVPGGSINVIPGLCRFSLDIRSGTDDRRNRVLSDVDHALDAIAQKRGVTLTMEEKLRSPAAICDSGIQARLARAIKSLNLPAPHLPSGAGHDAMVFAGLLPMGMLFVRCGNGGISHNPLETMTAEDADLAARAFLNFVQDLT